MNQTENKLKEISDMASAASSAAMGMLQHVSEIQANMSEEDKKKFNDTLRKVNVEAIMSDLNKAQSDLSNYLKTL